MIFGIKRLAFGHYFVFKNILYICKTLRNIFKMKTILITGATEGIGYEFAQLFANGEYQLLLTARNTQKLQEMCTAFSAQGISCRFFAKDLSIITEAISLFEEIKKEKIEVNYLINNAGFGVYGRSSTIAWDKEFQMYQLNMITLAYLTKQFSKEMEERGFGRILNVASIAAFQPLPYMAGYAASKAFVLSLSQSLNEELKGNNVFVSTLCPGVTESKFHSTATTEEKLLGSKLFPIASAKEVAQYGTTLLLKGTSFGIYGIFNKVQVGLLRVLPRWVVTKGVGKMMK